MTPLITIQLSPTRARAVVLSAVFQYRIEKALQALQMIGLLAIAVNTLQINAIKRPPVLLLPIIALDISLGLFRFFYILRLGIFLLYSKILLAFVECAHLKSLNGSLRELSRKGTACSRFWLSFGAFNRQHNDVGHDILQSNRRLVSPILFSALLSNIVFNVYLLSFIFFLDYGAENKFGDTFTVGLQLAIAYITIQPLIRLTALYHASGRTLMRLPFAQLKSSFKSSSKFVAESQIKNQLKLLALCECVHSDDKLYFTVGPLGGVSYANAGEVWNGGRR